MKKRVFIHAGAHRTGTSSFQRCLFENASRLKDAGYDVAYPGRDGVPKANLRMKLPRRKMGVRHIPDLSEKLQQHLNRISPDPARALVISEENIPGAMVHFYDAQFFPGIEKRLRVLANATGGRVAHLLYIVRPYDDLFMSAYRNRAAGRAMPDFRDLIPQFLKMDRGWPETLAAMQDILRPERFTVLSYDRRGTSVDLLSVLLPEFSSGDCVEPSQVLNLSANGPAIRALQARFRAGEDLGPVAISQVIKDHVDDDTPTPELTYSDAVRETLRARYLADLEKISSMNGITARL